MCPVADLLVTLLLLLLLLLLLAGEDKGENEKNDEDFGKSGSLWSLCLAVSRSENMKDEEDEEDGSETGLVVRVLILLCTSRVACGSSTLV